MSIIRSGRNQLWLLLTIFLLEIFFVFSLPDTTFARLPDQSSTESTIIVGNLDGSAINLEPNQTFNVTISIHDIPEGTNIGSVMIDIHYDGSLLKPLKCEPLSLDKFSIMCDVNHTSGVVRLNGLSRDGGFRNVDLVEVEWEAMGPAGSNDTLRVEVQTFTDNNGTPLPYNTQDQVINIPQAGSAIQGQKWQDNNGDGLQDPDEPGVKDWIISLFGLAETITATTDANGEYRFTNLEQGLYNVFEGPKSGWIQTFPSNGVHRVTLRENQVVKDLNFGSRPGGNGCITFSGLQHCPQGRAELDVENDMLVVSNIGSGDQDGVTINLGEGKSVVATIGNIQMDSISPIEALDIIAVGTLDNLPGQRLSSIRLVDMDEGYMAISADMSSLGVDNPTINIYNGNGEQVPHSETNRIVVAMPPTFGYKINPIWSMNGIVVATVTLPEEVEITLADGEVVMGSQIDFEGGELGERLGPAPQLDILSTGFPSFALEETKVVNEQLDILTDTSVVIGNLDSSAMNVAQDQDIDVPVSIHDIPADVNVHVATIKISYDVSVLKPVICSNHPDADFETMLCNLTFAPGVIRINGVSTEGVSGNVNLALIKWKAVGSSGDSTTLEADVQRLGKLDEVPISHTTQSQIITITQMGDVNCNGIIDSVDALFILQYDIGKRTSSNQCPPSPGTIYLPSCDVSNDGECSSIDALFILQCDVGDTNSFCP